MKAALVRALGALVALLPAAAYACPSCATREGGSGVYVMVGLMIAVPYLVAAVAFRVIRRAIHEDRPRPAAQRAAVREVRP